MVRHRRVRRRCSAAAKRLLAVLAAVISVGLGVLLFLRLKRAFGRRRPCAMEPHCWATLLPPDQFSFPSGHTITAFAMALSLGAFLSRDASRACCSARPAWRLRASCWACISLPTCWPGRRSDRGSRIFGGGRCAARLLLVSRRLLHGLFSHTRRARVKMVVSHETSSVGCSRHHVLCKRRSGANRDEIDRPPRRSDTSRESDAGRASHADLLHPSSLNRTAPATFRVKLATTKGDIVIECDPRLGAARSGPFLQSGARGLLHRCAVLPRDPQLHGAVRHQRPAGGEPRLQGRQHSGRSAQRPIQQARQGDVRDNRRPEFARHTRCSSTLWTTRTWIARDSCRSAKWWRGWRT